MIAQSPPKATHKGFAQRYTERHKGAKDPMATVKSTYETCDLAYYLPLMEMVCYVHITYIFKQSDAPFFFFFFF